MNTQSFAASQGGRDQQDDPRRDAAALPGIVVQIANIDTLHMRLAMAAQSTFDTLQHLRDLIEQERPRLEYEAVAAIIADLSTRVGELRASTEHKGAPHWRDVRYGPSCLKGRVERFLTGQVVERATARMASTFDPMPDKTNCDADCSPAMPLVSVGQGVAARAWNGEPI